MPKIVDWRYTVKKNGVVTDTDPTNVVIKEEFGGVASISFVSKNGEYDNLLGFGDTIELHVGSYSGETLQQRFNGAVYARRRGDGMVTFDVGDPVALLNREWLSITDEDNYDGMTISQMFYEIMYDMLVARGLDTFYSLNVQGPDPQIIIDGLRKKSVNAGSLLKRLLRDAIDYDALYDDNEVLKYYPQVNYLNQDINFTRELSMKDVEDQTDVFIDIDDRENAMFVKPTEKEKQIVNAQRAFGATESVRYTNANSIKLFGTHEVKPIDEKSVEEDTGKLMWIARNSVESSISDSRRMPVRVSGPTLFWIRPHDIVFLFSETHGVQIPGRVLNKSLTLVSTLKGTASVNFIPPKVSDFLIPQTVIDKVTRELVYPSIE